MLFTSTSFTLKSKYIHMLKNTTLVLTREADSTIFLDQNFEKEPKCMFSFKIHYFNSFLELNHLSMLPFC